MVFTNYSNEAPRTWWRASAVFRVEIESHSAGTAEPAIPAEPRQTGSDAGAEQWYKTIAKLMQGRNSIPHLHSEPLGVGIL